MTWTLDDAARFYRLPHWGAGHVRLNDRGHVVICPDTARPDQQIDLPELIERLQQQGMTLPLLIRFTDILRQRVRVLTMAFARAMQQQDYAGRYTLAYPIKVNQQHQVVSAILSALEGCSSHAAVSVGAEAGSKPELLALLGIVPPGTTIVCNGYKDREYVRLALIGHKLGHRVYLVLEKPSELALVLAQARQLGVNPLLGVRARLASAAKGHWQQSAGEKAKFGLTASQLLAVVEHLHRSDQLSCLQLVHFHIGSQVASLDAIALALRECAQVFAGLCQLGAPVSVVDVGGGLGVDYAGTHASEEGSIDYGFDDYAQAVVSAFARVCADQGLAVPDIISESGRAMTAHHAVLVTNVAAQDSHPPAEVTPPATQSAELQALWQLAQQSPALAEARAFWQQLGDGLARVQQAFVAGRLTLAERGWAENLLHAQGLALQSRLSAAPDEDADLLAQLQLRYADRLFANFSLFQSLPDAWGIDQLFPVLPLSGLEQPPRQRALVMDITCDSDGVVRQYVDDQGVATTLALPALATVGERWLGFFLVGAYQEILGDLHNLFGDADSVQVRLDETGVLRVDRVLLGNTVEEVLRMVDYDAKTLLASFKQQMHRSGLTAEERALLLAELVQGLSGYPYLEE